MKLRNEIKDAMRAVLTAEENAAAWKEESRAKMKKVNIIIAAEEKRSETKIDRKELIAEIRKELSEETAEPTNTAEA